MSVQELQKVEISAAVPSVLTPMELLDRAFNSNAAPETLERLMALQERWEKNQARKSFDEAMAAAKAEIPVISKNRTVDFTSQKGRTHYKHEDLAEVARTVTPILAKHGLSYRFRTTSNVNEPVTVTCIVSHREGHFEENTLAAGRDESGSKNQIQAVGSTLTYLQRMTLKAALGLAASDDDDGAGSDGKPSTISNDQVGELQALIESKNADKARFLKYYKIERLSDLPASSFNDAMARLIAKGG